ncbi:MAG: CoA pyrophosphatase [Anaerovoracaceae bacterium]|nr:CoA pyrophosphatase [Bacillota bacterium]MDY2671022.1 CoA pyrophosphatase [Anaerovoracaceae bacterium]
MRSNDITERKLKRALEFKLPRKDTSSSVLVPMVNTDAGWEVLFEVRSDTVSQPGEVAFPGGHLESGERSIDAVLRETVEEIGVTPESVKILGELPRERIQGGRLVKPFVGLLSDYAYKNIKTSAEVQQVFTVPMSFLMNKEPERYSYKMSIENDESLPEVLQKHLSVETPYGVTLYWEYNGFGIWGLTARILNNLILLTQMYQD